VEGLTAEQRKELNYIAESQRTVSILDRDTIVAVLATIDRQAERIRGLEATEATNRQYRVYRSAPNDPSQFLTKTTSVPSLVVARIEAKCERQRLAKARNVNATVEIQTRVASPWVRVEEGEDDAV
jgi:hypothetical protein